MAGDDPVALCSAVLRDRIAPFLRSAPSAAMAGFPEDHNCGDYANCLGALSLLEELGLELSYGSTWGSLQMDVLTGCSGGSVLLLSNALSAGNLPESQVTRTISSLPNRIILLPERVTMDRPPVQALATVISGHPDLCVLAREASAAQHLAQTLGGKVRIEMAPPLSFLLGRQPRKTEPEYDLVWVARTGRKDGSVEATARLSSQSAEKIDLPEFADGIEIDVVAKRRPPTVMLTDWSSLVFRTQEARLSCNALKLPVRAEAYFQRGLHILSLGRVVITDRVGAHIMCLLLGLPHVFVDDGTGANRSFFDSWTRNAQSCRFAETPARAWSLARSMLRSIDE